MHTCNHTVLSVSFLSVLFYRVPIREHGSKLKKVPILLTKMYGSRGCARQEIGIMATILKTNGILAQNSLNYTVQI
jgi:hypothetical protein